MVTVAKFGGSSMADADSIRRVADIVQQQSARRVIVVSAPGHCARYPFKVTEALLNNEINLVYERLSETMEELAIDTTKLPGMIAYISRAAEAKRVAFGEYMSAYILAQVLQYRFIDARRVFTVHHDKPEALRYQTKVSWHPVEQVVIPGFYGRNRSGHITLFPRGGSDISGALLAEALKASLYENWTDVSGVYPTDPRSGGASLPFARLTYDAAESLFQAGAQVLHVEAVYPVRRAGVPVVIRNTFVPSAPGTLIVA